MIEVGQIWTHKNVYAEDVKIIKIDYKINCVTFNWGGVNCVSNLSGFLIRYDYNAKKTNELIIQEIIE